MKKITIITIVAAIILTALTSKVTAQTNAQTSLTNVVVKYPWNSSITAGVSLTRGNSDSLLATIKYLTSRKTPVNEFDFDADAAYGSANGVANNETLHGSAQWNHLFSDRFFGYLRADGLHDGIAEIKYRFVGTAGAGYYFIKTAQTTLAGEVGPGVVTERLGDTDDTFATIRFAERGEHKFDGHGARIWESVEYLPQVNKTSNYLVNSEVGAEAAMAKNLSLSICLDDYFNSDPADGRQKNDVKLVSGVTYSF
jgi:putative salt-induced outer membrane protein YdiY